MAASDNTRLDLISLKFEQAVALHQQGRLIEAERSYREVIAEKPDHFDGLHLLGVIAIHTGRCSAGIALIRSAIQINPTVPEAYNNLANALRAAHQLDEALVCCDKALSLRPDYVEAHASSGHVFSQSGKLAAAVASYDRAIELNPGFTEAYYNRGLVLGKLGRAGEALASYDKALRIKSDFVEAHNNRGNALVAVGRLTDALGSYDAAIALKPDYAEAFANRCSVLRQLGRPDDALTNCDQALALRPDDALTHNNRGLVLVELRRNDEALASYDEALKLIPGFVEAHNNRGVVLTKMKRADDALASYDRAIAAKAECFEAYCNRGLTLRRMRRLDDALASYEKAIALKPDYVDAWNDLGLVQHQLGRFEDAVASFDHVIRMMPDHAAAHSHRGVVLNDLKRFDEALESHDRALALSPAYANAYNNRAIVLFGLLRLEEAAACFDQAIALNPAYGDAYFNKSLLLLLTGAFEQGWRLYEWRKNLPKNLEFYESRACRRTLWLGQTPIAGKTLFVSWEQGFGDTIQFCRFAKEAVNQGASVFLSVQNSLVVLIATLDPAIKVIDETHATDGFDFHCPMLSLPLALKVTLGSLPVAVPYLTVDQRRRSLWRLKIGAKRGMRVGLAWSGSPSHDNDRHRSIPLSLLLMHLPTGPDYCCLQKELQPHDQEILAQSKHIRFFGAELRDFADTAALCELMDIIISVDTAIVHLAGAIGKEVWLLLRGVPDWRWLLERRDSPWYATARLFRQTSNGDWTEVLSELNAELAQRLTRMQADEESTVQCQPSQFQSDIF